MSFRFHWSTILVVTLWVMSVIRASAQESSAEAPIRVAIAGLTHGHSKRVLDALPLHKDIQLVGIVETDSAVVKKYTNLYHLEPALFFATLEQLIEKEHPSAVLAYSSIAAHRGIIEIAAKHGVNVMVEKPLATTLADAVAIRSAAEKNHIQVLVNYETTWYSSNSEAYRQAESGKLGILRRVVVSDGHRGPKAMHTPAEFEAWLLDPKQNGAGALFDFGCYGAALMTWLMHGQAPLSVTAVAQTDEPALYTKVDDDATVILRYSDAVAVLQPSWHWPFPRKDMEVYGSTGYAITVGLDKLRVRYANDKTETLVDAPPQPEEDRDSLNYLVALLRKRINPQGDMSSLRTNMIVMQILEAAKKSAATGTTIALTPLAP